MRNLSSLIQIQRHGVSLGSYPPQELVSLLETGYLRSDDLCTSQENPEPMRLSSYVKSLGPDIVISGPRQHHSSHRSHHRSSRKKYLVPMLVGWAAFLLAAAALVGSSTWIKGVYKELEQAKIRLQVMDKALRETKEQYQRLLFVSGEVAEKGSIRGNVIMRNEVGERIAMAGVQVYLYPRLVIEDYLKSKMQERANLPFEVHENPLAFFMSELPAPLLSTVTDSRGRFEFKLPEEGEYVIYTSISTDIRSGPSNKIWFVAFNSHDQLNSLVNITETNDVRQFLPSLMIVEGR